MSKETTDTLGHQKETNYALKASTKEEFIKLVLQDLEPAPSYFSINALMNKQGYSNVDELIKQGTIALNSDEFQQAQQQTRALLLDTRNPSEFKQGFIPGAINIGLNGQFAPWAGTLISDLSQPILLITDTGKEEETVIRLSRVGIDHVIGYLKGGFQSWIEADKPSDRINAITPKEFLNHLTKDAVIIDVRKTSEYENGHLETSVNLPLDYINDWTLELDKNKTYYIHCAGGYRSVITESILKSRNINNIIDIEGGYSAIEKELNGVKS